ncbi:hypothetical protein EDD22DRAFT_877109 [Suillus occidentalis]|nr:hypothetical protein EDD22DRAFT_877109 [Suillus occidentalis]
MRFWPDLAVVAALTVSVYATSIPVVDSVNDNCPYFCVHDSACKNCWMGHKCVSMSGLRLSFLDAFGLSWQEKGDCEAGPELHNIRLNQFSSSCSSLTWG